MVTVWSRSDIACRTLDVGNVTDKFERERFKFKPFAKCERATNLYGFSAFNLKDTLINFFVAVGSPSVKPNFFSRRRDWRTFLYFRGINDTKHDAYQKPTLVFLFQRNGEQYYVDFKFENVFCFDFEKSPAFSSLTVFCCYLLTYYFAS